MRASRSSGLNSITPSGSPTVPPKAPDGELSILGLFNFFLGAIYRFISSPEAEFCSRSSRLNRWKVFLSWLALVVWNWELPGKLFGCVGIWKFPTKGLLLSYYLLLPIIEMVLLIELGDVIRNYGFESRPPPLGTFRFRGVIGKEVLFRFAQNVVLKVECGEGGLGEVGDVRKFPVLLKFSIVLFECYTDWLFFLNKPKLLSVLVHLGL